MGGTSDKLNIAIPENLQGTINWEYKLQFHLQSLLLEEPKLHGGGDSKILIGYQVRNSNFQDSISIRKFKRQPLCLQKNSKPVNTSYDMLVKLASSRSKKTTWF
jgi:hypothetical protein